MLRGGAGMVQAAAGQQLHTAAKQDCDSSMWAALVLGILSAVFAWIWFGGSKERKRSEIRQGDEEPSVSSSETQQEHAGSKQEGPSKAPGEQVDKTPVTEGKCQVPSTAEKLHAAVEQHVTAANKPHASIDQAVERPPSPAKKAVERPPSPAKKAVERPPSPAEKHHVIVDKPVAKSLLQVGNIHATVDQTVKKPVPPAEKSPVPVVSSVPPSPAKKAVERPPSPAKKPQAPLDQAEEKPVPPAEKPQTPLDQAEEKPVPPAEKPQTPLDQAEEKPVPPAEKPQTPLDQAEEKPVPPAEKPQTPLDQAEEKPVPPAEKPQTPLDQAEEKPVPPAEKPQTPLDQAEEKPVPLAEKPQTPLDQAEEKPVPPAEKPQTPLDQAEEKPVPPAEKPQTPVEKPPSPAEKHHVIVDKPVAKSLLQVGNIHATVDQTVKKPVPPAEKSPVPVVSSVQKEAPLPEKPVETISPPAKKPHDPLEKHALPAEKPPVQVEQSVEKLCALTETPVVKTCGPTVDHTPVSPENTEPRTPSPETAQFLPGNVPDPAESITDRSRVQLQKSPAPKGKVVETAHSAEERELEKLPASRDLLQASRDSLLQDKVDVVSPVTDYTQERSHKLEVVAAEKPHTSEVGQETISTEEKVESALDYQQSPQTDSPVENSHADIANKLDGATASSEAVLQNTPSDAVVEHDLCGDQRENGSRSEQTSTSLTQTQEPKPVLFQASKRVPEAEKSTNHLRPHLDGSLSDLQRLPLTNETFHPPVGDIMMPAADPTKMKQIAAVHPMPHDVNVDFKVHYYTHSDQLVAVVGDHEKLGKWEAYIPLTYEKDGFWSHSVALPVDTSVEWKFVMVENGKIKRWEECGNRHLKTEHDIEANLNWGFQ